MRLKKKFQKLARGENADENVYAAACAVEFLHTESVIHDDMGDHLLDKNEHL